ncbi:LysR family transcriptional regulator [Shinella zoogloeoides]|uniref:LysR family transcriptional regulator n=1 Tax=Shinella zoogloeoides TaxID=352475 RepID=UPI0028A8EC49|nr:LysR family transcriptional regulator [Shinella zoogloeoides]
MIDLNDMALFVEVVKAKSFRRAAEALGMPNSTLSRRISALEASIGLRLFHRTTRRIEVTEAGQVYFDRCQRIVEEANLAHEQLGEYRTEPTGTLRVSLPVDFACRYLAPLIAEFCRMHPDIRFELDLTPRNIDLVAEPYDVAVRMRPQPDSHMIARPLVMLLPKLYASPGYLARAGEPVKLTDLTEHQCIDFPKVTTWHLCRGDEKIDVAIDGRIRLNSPGMSQRLATFDAGVVLIPEELVSEEVADGRLRRVLPDWQGEPAPVFVLTESKLLPAKTQHFIHFLRERLR